VCDYEVPSTPIALIHPFDMPDHTEQNDPYMLPRDDSEHYRLTVQHSYLLKHVYDDKYIYDESVVLGENSQILDAGTGTGAWALGLAKEVPESVQIYGTDISTNNFPTSTPPNVHLTVASTMSLPEEWTGRFDLLHQRYLLAAFLREQWPTVLSEMYRVLKPGGTVQVVELDLLSPKSKGPAMEEVYKICKGCYDKNGLVFEIASILGPLLEKAGFVDIQVEKKSMPMGKMWGEYGKQGVITMKNAYKNLRNAMLKVGVIQSEMEFFELLDKMEKEWDEHGVQYASRIITARKPINTS